eukprot:969100-Amphidinium_carterae.1
MAQLAASGSRGDSHTAVHTGDTEGQRFEEPTHRVWGSVELSEDSSEPSCKGKIAPDVTFHALSESSFSSSSADGRRDTAVEHCVNAAGAAAAPPRTQEWSEGAKLHETGECRPCAWHWRAAGCVNAANCEFCHLCDEGALKARRKQRLLDALRAENPTMQQLRRRLWARRNNAPAGQLPAQQNCPGQMLRYMSCFAYRPCVPCWVL